MFNKNSSAGTAAQKRSKCSLLVGRPLLLAILLLSAVFCQAQIGDTTWKAATDSNIKLSGNYLYGSIAYKDSCRWQLRIDTVNVDFVITVDENGFVKKQKVDFIIHQYEEKQCEGVGISFYTPNRNDSFLLKREPVEVLLYRPKGQNMLVGNSR